MRVLVTGATGFVGGAVARALLEQGESVHVLARARTRAEALEELGARVFLGSIGDPNEVARAASGCDVVVHAAAESSHRASGDVLEWVNVAGTENVLNAAKHVLCKRLVFVSCADVTLANEDRVYWNEKRTLGRPPIDAHARTKLLAEEIVLSASGTDIECVALRPARIWGPGDTTFLPGVCKTMREGKTPLVGGGTKFFATTYIDNLVSAVLLALRAPAAAGRAYYIQDDELIRAREFFVALANALGMSAPRSGLPYEWEYAMAVARSWFGASGRWPTDVIRFGRGTHFDTQEARKDLGYEPKITLEQGMSALAAWVQDAGGCEAIARMERRPNTTSDIGSQIAATAESN